MTQTMDQFGTSTGPLIDEEVTRIVDDILASVKDPNRRDFNPELAAQIQIWNELKHRHDDPHANALVDLVRAGHPLHRVYPNKVTNFMSQYGLVQRQQNRQAGYDNGAFGGSPQQTISGGGGGGGQSRYR